MDGRLLEQIERHATVQALDAWAKVWHMTDHPRVKQRRKELMKKEEGEKTESSLEPKDRYTVRTRPGKRFKKVLSETVYEISFHKSFWDRTLIDLYDMMEKVFDDILTAPQSDPWELATVTLDHPDLKQPIFVPPTRKLRASHVMKEISRVLQSAEHLRLDADLTVKAGFIRMRKAGRGTALQGLTRACLGRKKSVLTVPPASDNLCAARALVLLLAHERRHLSPACNNAYRRLRSFARLTPAAQKLHRDAGLADDEPVGIDQVPAFERLLGRPVVVVSADHHHRPIYSGRGSGSPLHLYLVPNREGGYHYHAITNLKGFRGVNYLCPHCGTAFSKKHEHRCKRWCPVCQDHCSYTSDATLCHSCGALCRSTACFRRHQKGTPSLCERFTHCLQCGARGQRDVMRLHRCGRLKKCRRCHKTDVARQHDCYMRALRSTPTCTSFIFYDLECQQETGVHVPNVIVARTRCATCLSTPDPTRCLHCGTRCPNCDEWLYTRKTFKSPPCHREACARTEVVFEGPSALDAFCRWLLHEQHRGFTVIAHNQSGYDGIILLKKILQDYTPAPTNVIFRGTKLIHMILPRLRLRFIDSYLLIPLPLASMHRAFGLAHASKGFTPYLFNTRDNRNYVGPYPDAHFFSPGHMSTQRRREFEAWYERKKHKTYNHREKLIKYCRQDVNVLEQCCLAFRSEFLDATGFDPFSKSTLASVCMSVFRKCFLREELMIRLDDDDAPWLPAYWKNGVYSLEDGQTVPADRIREERFLRSPIALCAPAGVNHSKQSLQWIMWQEHCHGENGMPVTIQHALNGGEKEISYSGGTMRLDGFAVINGRATVWLYHGCPFHGCPTCFPARREDPSWIDMNSRYRATMRQHQILESMGYSVISIWSHEFEFQLRTHHALQRFVATLDLQDRMTPRSAFYGGRTEVFRMRCDQGVIHYLDFNGLYISVLMQNSFPVGTPQVITRDFLPLDTVLSQALSA